MDRTKLIPVVFLVIILIISFMAYQLNSEKKVILDRNDVLSSENKNLVEETNNLKSQLDKAIANKQVVEDRLNSIESDLLKAQKERDDFQARYQSVSGERDQLAQKLQERSLVDPRKVEEPNSQEYWVDVLKAKVVLEAKLDMLNKKLIDADTKVAEREEEARRLEMLVDEIEKEKDVLDEKLTEKTRALDAISRDFVNERQSRGKVMQEIRDMRAENIGLKRELSLMGRKKVKLQQEIRKVVEEKESLEGKVTEAQRTLAEEGLTNLVDDSEIESGQAELQKSRSIELPPIVVQPQEAGSVQSLSGEVISAVEDDNFVIVNLGEVAGVAPGMVLSVKREGKNIGTLEVIEARKEVCAAQIKELTQGLKVEMGDLVSVK